MKHDQILKLLGGLRYISMVAVVSAFLGSFAMFYIGAEKAVMSVYHLTTRTWPDDADRNLAITDVVTMNLLESLDSFLFALVLLYTAYGIYMLFIVGCDSECVNMGDVALPRSLVPQSIAELKENLAVVIIVILFVLLLEVAWGALDNLEGKTWELLVYPIAIVMLALALRLLNLGRKDGR